MIIEVKNCRECPFANIDNEYGYDYCNLLNKLDIYMNMKMWEELPEDKRHPLCPIDNEVIIKAANV